MAAAISSARVSRPAGSELLLGESGPIHSGWVDIRKLKDAARELNSADPLRILILSEPDDMTREQYVAKIVAWFRLTLRRNGPLG